MEAGNETQRRQAGKGIPTRKAPRPSSGAERELRSGLERERIGRMQPGIGTQTRQAPRPSSGAPREQIRTTKELAGTETIGSMQTLNGTPPREATAAGDPGYGFHGDDFNLKGLAFAACIAIAGALFMAVLALMYRVYRFVTLEIAMRRRSIPFVIYPPKGTAYPAGDVHTVCAVCISEFSSYSRVAVLPPCGHIFHRRCLREEVARESPRCPLCRAAL